MFKRNFKLKNKVGWIFLLVLFVGLLLPVGADHIVEGMQFKEVTDIDRSNGFSTTYQEETSIAGIPSGFQFQRNLSYGNQGEDVKYLQILLNTDPDTRLTGRGAGAPGWETEHFGSLTRDAVARFQEKYAEEILYPQGLTSGTGRLDSYTRSKMNSILKGGTREPTDYQDPDVLGETDTTDREEELIAQLESLMAELDNLQRRIDEIEEGRTDLDDEIAEMYLTRMSTPRNVQIGPEQTKEVAGFRVESDYGGLRIQRIELEMKGRDLTRSDLARKIRNISLYSNGNKEKTFSVDRNNIDRYGDYIRITGLDIRVPADSSREVLIEVETDYFSLTDGEDGAVELAIRENGLRARDGAGVSHEEGVDLRDFELIERGLAEISVRETDRSPEEGIVLLERDGRTEGVELLEFELEVEEEEVEVFDLFTEITLEHEEKDFDDEYDYFDDIISDVALYYEGDLWEADTSRASISGKSEEREILHPVDLTLEEGTHLFSVEVDVEELEDGYEGMTVKADVDAKDLEAEDLYDYELLTGNQLSGIAEGETQHLYTTVPEIKNVSTDTITTIHDGVAIGFDGEIIFDVEALGDDIELDYLSFTESVEDVYVEIGDEEIADGTEDFAAEENVFDGDTYELRENDRKTVEILAYITEETGRRRLEIEDFGWDGNKLTPGMIEDLKTDRIRLFN